MRTGRPPRDLSALPLPVWEDAGRRWVWRRSEVENFRRVLAGEPPKAAKVTKGGEEPVSITELAEELGIDRRTVTRRVAEARAKASAPEASAAPFGT